MNNILNTRSCKSCDVIFNVRNFPLAKSEDIKDSNGNPYRRHICSDCYNDKKSEERRIRKNNRRMNEKSDLACEMCNYSQERDGDYFVIENIQFHHHDNNKLYDIADMWNMSMKKIKEEIAKCTVLCILCHGWITVQDRINNN